MPRGAACCYKPWCSSPPGQNRQTNKELNKETNKQMQKQTERGSVLRQTLVLLSSRSRLFRLVIVLGNSSNNNKKEEEKTDKESTKV